MNALDLALALGMALSDPSLMTPPITKEQEAVIAKLADEDYYVREKASATLEKMDFAAMRAIRKALNHEDPEVRQRAERLIGKFYACTNSKNEMPGIHGLYKLESFKLSTGRTVELYDSITLDYYSSVGGESSDYEQNTNIHNQFTRLATARYVRDLRNQGFTRQEVTEILDKITEESAGEGMGEAGYKKFREMQGLPEYEHGGP